jgi:hypothetical protein
VYLSSASKLERLVVCAIQLVSPLL